MVRLIQCTSKTSWRHHFFCFVLEYAFLQFHYPLKKSSWKCALILRHKEKKKKARWPNICKIRKWGQWTVLYLGHTGGGQHLIFCITIHHLWKQTLFSLHLLWIYLPSHHVQHLFSRNLFLFLFLRIVLEPIPYNLEFRSMLAYWYPLICNAFEGIYRKL